MQDRKYFSFLVRVIDRGYLNVAGGYTQFMVFDSLELQNKGWTVVGKSCWSFIQVQGLHNVLVDDKHGFLLMTLVCTSRSLEDVNTW